MQQVMTEYGFTDKYANANGIKLGDSITFEYKTLNLTELLKDLSNQASIWYAFVMKHR